MCNVKMQNTSNSGALYHVESEDEMQMLELTSSVLAYQSLIFHYILCCTRVGSIQSW